MDPVESMEVLDSEGGNGVPVEPTAPSPEVPEPETPADEPVVVQADPTPEAEPNLFSLPDGRKVDAETLYKEYAENLLPDYTRKSQELAKIKAAEPKLQTNEPVAVNPLANPEWQPESWEQVIEVAKQSLRDDLESQKAQEEARRNAVEAQVSQQLDIIKKVDPKIDENALFVHATKYGFRDLVLAHKNLSEHQAALAAAIKGVQKMTVENITKRNDPISSSPGSPSGAPPNRHQFSTATEYLRSIK